MDKNFKKHVDEMTKQDWEDLYQFRSRIGSFYSNAIDSGEKLEHFYKLSLKQEEIVKELLESYGYQVEYLDKDREYIFAYVENHGTPDLVITDEAAGESWTAEVKNFYTSSLRSNNTIKLNFRANVYGLDEEQMKKAIWKKNFHDADVVYFVSSEVYFVSSEEDSSEEASSSCFYPLKFAKSYKYDMLDMKIVGNPDNTLNCKQRITAYLPVSYTIGYLN